MSLNQSKQSKNIDNKLTNIDNEINILTNIISNKKSIDITLITDTNSTTSITDTTIEEDTINKIKEQQIRQKSKVTILLNKKNEYKKKISHYQNIYKSLSLNKDNILQKEKEIYTNEKNRIASKFTNYINNIQEELNILQLKYNTLCNETRDKELECNKCLNTMRSFKEGRLELRTNYLKKIKERNKKEKEIMLNKNNLHLQLNDIIKQITSVQLLIDNYSELRRKINQDYYNWKKDINDTNTALQSLKNEIKLNTFTNNIDTQINTENDNLFIENNNINNIILQDENIKLLEYRYNFLIEFNNKLKNDYRQYPEKNYNKLDIDLQKWEHNLLNLTKQKNYIIKQLSTTHIVKNINLSKGVFASSPHLKNETEIYNYNVKLVNTLKPIIKKNNNILQELTKDIDKLQNILNENTYPNNLKEQLNRCNIRYKTINERTKNKYNMDNENNKQLLEQLLKECNNTNILLENERENYLELINKNNSISNNLNNSNLVNSGNYGNSGTRKLYKQSTNINEINNIINLKNQLQRLKNDKQYLINQTNSN